MLDLDQYDVPDVSMAVDVMRQADDSGEIEYAPGDEPTVQQESLIVGRRMKCPRCERLHDILEYVPMQTIEKFAAATNPVYKCPSCRWIFSPGVNDLEERISFLEGKIRELEAPTS